MTDRCAWPRLPGCACGPCGRSRQAWAQLAASRKLQVFYGAPGQFSVVGGLPGSGEGVVPPSGQELAVLMAELALQMQEIKVRHGTAEQPAPKPPSRGPCFPRPAVASDALPKSEPQ
jgi:hypothetical protein|eukprot:COSAG01_NODE_1172_length_11400_cov_12.759579_11_plen_117_part_00